ncbi:MAG: NmrA family NAD(P)-binding protein [Bacteroidetes bacterium]|nr:NmrA family NAD(P)-binding protein [Bacteroidota bacterium]
MQKPFTIIGAGGSIANNLVEILIKNREMVRLVSRKGIMVPGCETVAADALNSVSLQNAVKGSQVVYILIGLEYKTKVWEAQWPVVMQNIISSCEAEQVPVIFFDNVYMYGIVNGKMTESTPINPCSKKGKIRASIAQSFLEACESGRIKGLIARSADFYGPHSEKMSFFHAMTLDPMLKGKAVRWMMNDKVPHSMTFTIDAAHGIYLLSKDSTVWNRVWHLPTSAPALTGQQLIRLAAEINGKTVKHQVVGKGMLKILGWFIPAIAESIEMLYQVEFPYEFDSSDFNKHFNYTPVSYEDGLKISIRRQKSGN